jgi:cytoskeletal protein RodZ
MRQVFRRHPGVSVLLTLAALLMSAAAFGQSQSLGDIARENRDKKAENSIAQPKVFTNSTLPKDPDAATNAASGAPSATTTAPSSSSTSPFSDKTSAEKPATFPEERAMPPHAARPRSAQQRSVQQQLAEQRAAQQRLDEKRAAAQWRKKILQQEQTVAGLRMRVDMLKASIRFVDPNRYGTGSASDYYAGLNYNRGEARQLQRLARMQQELDEQRRKLEGMQEAARHAGMHTLVYDP